MSLSRHQREAEALAARRRRAEAARSSAAARSAARRAGRATRGAGSWAARGKTPALLFKQHRGGLAGLKYSAQKHNAIELASNLFSESIEDKKTELMLDAQRHPFVKTENIFLHFSISAADGVKLSQEKWRQLVTRQLQLMGFEGCQYYSVLHHDTDHGHAHIVVSRSSPITGKLVSLSQSYYRFRSNLRQVEAEMGLRAIDVERSPARPSDTAVNALRRAKRRGATPAWVNPDEIRTAIYRSSTPQQFAEELYRRGIEIQIATRKDGAPTGILIRKKGAEEFLAGSSIGREFSLQKINAQLEQNRRSEQNRVTRQRQQMHQHQENQHPRERE